MDISLFKALQVGLKGAEIVRRGVDPKDDPHGYAGCPGTTGKGGAYFTTEATFAIGLVPKKDYRNGVLMVTLAKKEYDALCKSGRILPDTYHPSHSVRVLPSAFAEFNAATQAPSGTRAYFASGSTLPTGHVVP